MYGEGIGGIKIVCVGDGAIGKTSLLISYHSHEFQEEHVPTIFENVTIEKTIEINGAESEISLDLWDTAGQEQFDRLRILAYRNTDIFLLCFSVISKVSFKNLEYKWIPEIKQHAPNALILLVGTKSDLKDDSHEIVHKNDVALFREKCGASEYVETSALERTNVDLCFQLAIKYFLESSTKKNSKESSFCPCALL